MNCRKRPDGCPRREAGAQQRSGEPTVVWRLWQLTQRLVALLLLLAASPLLAILFVMVKLDSPGPFLYRQRRPGHRGSRFTALKIRTMIVGADRNPMLARAVTAATPEITRVGRYLRELKLDELPQLWNVVRAEMVLVGPRPIAEGLNEYLEAEIPGFAARLEVPPGLTSLGQVCIVGNESLDRVLQDWSVRFEAERHYLAHRSVAYDLVIIGMTAAYCLRKLTHELSGIARPRLERLGVAAIALVLAVLVSGCSGPAMPEGLVLSEHGLSRVVPWDATGTAEPVVEHETVEVQSLARGEADPIYRLGPGDLLAINVFAEPGMENLIVQLDGVGEIQLPMLERVRATGLSLSELQLELKRGYAEHFLDPWVVVQLHEPRSRPLYLLGEFNQPGIVHMSSSMNVIQALAEGRGLSEKAYTRGARLIRDGQIAPVDIHALLNMGRMDQNTWLQPNDTIYVPGLDDLRIYVLGAVEQPGAQEFSNSVPTLVEAIARSGGPRRGEAQLRQVRVIRPHSPVSGELFVVDLTRILDGEAIDMPLQPGDIVFLPVNGVGDWNEVIAAISPTILMVSRALDPFVLAKGLEDN